MPSSSAIRRAVAWLSPVSITTWTPSSCSAATAAAAVGRAASASAITPAGAAVDRHHTAVRPAAGELARATRSSAPRSTPSRSSRRGLPTATRRPSTSAIAPCPGTFSNRPASSRATPAGLGVRRRRPGRGDAPTRARPRRPAASSSASSSPTATTSVTSGSPLVRVPVLSITTVSIRAEVSSAAAFLNSTPRRAPSPVPTMIAVGVARPSASGQVTTTTVMANSSASVSGWSENSAQAANVTSAADQRDEHQPERGPVGQPLPGRLGVLRLLDELRRSGPARCRRRPWWRAPAACRRC